LDVEKFDEGVYREESISDLYLEKSDEEKSGEDL